MGRTGWVVVGAVVLAAAAAAVAGAPAGAAQAPARTAPVQPRDSGARVVSALVKVRPGALPAGKAAAELALARGECEAVQVVLPEGATPAGALTLKGPGGAGLAARLYRVGYVPVQTPSNSEGATGAWPDPLLPWDAPWDGAGPRVAWVELCAPEAQAPGTYTGAWELGGGRRVPFTARVHRFVLPATASLPTSFGLSLVGVARGHGLPRDGAEAHALTRAYAAALLEHRVSPHGLSFAAPPARFVDGEVRVDWAAYDAEVGPLLDGSLLASGARATTFDVRMSPTARTEEERAAWVRALAAHHREKGWPAQLFFYAKDEPKPADYPLVLTQAAAVRRAGAGVPVLVTTPLNPTLQPATDVFAPTLNCFFPRPGPQTCSVVHPVAQLRTRVKKDARVWWYQSCNSHGCTGGPADDPAIEAAYKGWASYMVDHPATLNRAMGPLAYLAGVDGELYFDTVNVFHAGDPWKGVFAFGGNGDGTFFYPGTPARLGGDAHRPVVSVRLKHVRDGLEDYEYLRLLEKLGDGAFARAAVRKLAASGWQVERDPAVWEDVRRQLAARLNARWATSEYRGAGPVQTRP